MIRRSFEDAAEEWLDTWSRESLEGEGPNVISQRLVTTIALQVEGLPVVYLEYDYDEGAAFFSCPVALGPGRLRLPAEDAQGIYDEYRLDDALREALDDA